MKLRTASLALPLVALLALSSTTGCRITKTGSGNKENVDVATPFGSVNVKTDDARVAGNLGLALYPGAVPVKDKNDKDNDQADVNLNFGGFHLGVTAASYQTHDQPSQVEAFYRKDLAKYGSVLKCVDKAPVGEPTRTEQGLTCNDGKNDTVRVRGGAAPSFELRTGSPKHQRIVGIETKDGATKIGLVKLDLPGSVTFDSSDHKTAQ
ncbi:hypothetical protein ACFQBQ_11705 [Granulicella cerasi]|uniref:Lipoprotein n=1 Tax=Granulicella cerasi TaxID=741063 RepID=A0ABW1ZAL1_9BACT|nr:hypothetical protein [Granulicella cerasi]